MIHKLKVGHQFYMNLENGSKNFEIRKNDRNYEVNHILILKEYDHCTKRYTGREIRKRVTYILHHDQFPEGIKEGYVIMGLE